MHADGGGLYLQVTASGAKSWIYRFSLNGRAREMGLGPLHTVSLSDARVKATDCRQLRLAGVDPIEVRKEGVAAARLESAKAITFKDAAEAYIETHRAGWRNAKHANQWRATLDAYAYPVLGSLPVQGVDVALVMKVLEPIWTSKTETAARVRGRVESVLDWASARGYRLGGNPARWRGHLENLLPKRAKVRAVQHHPALPYEDVGEFMALLKDQVGTAARALEFLILTASRTGEVTGATRDEIDLDGAVWTVPAHRIKTTKKHRVPLSARALSIIQDMQTDSNDDFVFPGGKLGKGLSNAAMLALLKRMDRSDLTVHGFRSTFRDWAAERTNYPREVAEMALAHAVSDKVEAAYRRGDLFKKRRRLMEEWSQYCDTAKAAGKVVSMRAGV
jgi:integrase